MKNALLAVGLLFGVPFALGQQLRSPAEVFQIMEKSSVTYELGILEDPIPVPDRSDNVNSNKYYRVVNDEEIVTYQYAIQKETKVFYDKAEKHFADKEYQLAKDMYFKVLETDSTYFEVMTYIGQIYEFEGDLEKAMEWYQKAIRNNYIDYMAHWFLAGVHQKLGQKEKAVDEITIALILNRNNPRLRAAFDNIYKKNKLKTSDWVFNPQIRLDSLGENKCKLSFSEDWLGYGMVKALYEFEPGFGDHFGIAKGTYSTKAELEAISCLLATLDKKKMKKVPEFKAIDLALNQDMIVAFILFEIILPQIPFSAYQFSEETVLDVKDYVIQIRGKGK